jgi:hypothetical protein
VLLCAESCCRSAIANHTDPWRSPWGLGAGCRSALPWGVCPTRGPPPGPSRPRPCLARRSTPVASGCAGLGSGSAGGAEILAGWRPDAGALRRWTEGLCLHGEASRGLPSGDPGLAPRTYVNVDVRVRKRGLHVRACLAGVPLLRVVLIAFRDATCPWRGPRALQRAHQSTVLHRESCRGTGTTGSRSSRRTFARSSASSEAQQQRQRR